MVGSKKEMVRGGGGGKVYPMVGVAAILSKSNLEVNLLGNYSHNKGNYTLSIFQIINYKVCFTIKKNEQCNTCQYFIIAHHLIWASQHWGRFPLKKLNPESWLTNLGSDSYWAVKPEADPRQIPKSVPTASLHCRERRPRVHRSRRSTEVCWYRSSQGDGELRREGVRCYEKVKCLLDLAGQRLLVRTIQNPKH